MKTNLFVIAKSGFSYVSFSLLATFIFAIFDLELLSLLSFLLFLVLSFIFRNPERELVNFEANSILSPVDGVVTDIEALEDNSEYGFCLRVNSNYKYVSLLRAPINGVVEVFSLVRGTKLASNSKHFENLNESASLTFKDESGNSLKVVHRLTQSFAPLDIDVQNRQKFMKSVRYGVMVCGVTEIYLPVDVRVNVSIGSNVKASETLLGFFS